MGRLAEGPNLLGGRRTIVELKELGTPATEAGRHASTLDGPDRFDVLKAYWLATTTEPDHFDVPDLLGARWVARDRLTRTNLDPAALSARGRRNAVAAEASQLALRHRKAWHKPKRGDLHDWLRDSTATLVDRWRAGYAAIGGR